MSFAPPFRGGSRGNGRRDQRRPYRGRRHTHVPRSATAIPADAEWREYREIRERSTAAPAGEFLYIVLHTGNILDSLNDAPSHRVRVINEPLGIIRAPPKVAW